MTIKNTKNLLHRYYKKVGAQTCNIGGDFKGESISFEKYFENKHVENFWSPLNFLVTF